LLLQRVIPVHCAFFRRRVYDTVGGFRCFSGEMAERGGNIGNVGVDIDFWYRAVHLFQAKFIPHHVAAYQLHPDQMTRHSPFWLRNMTRMVESCERDPRYGAKFKLSPDDRKEIFARWELLQERHNGNEAAVGRLVHRMLGDANCTDDRRQFLALHGFIPRQPRDPHAPRHPNHRVPDFTWFRRELAA